LISSGNKISKTQPKNHECLWENKNVAATLQDNLTSLSIQLPLWFSLLCSTGL